MPIAKSKLTTVWTESTSGVAKLDNSVQGGYQRLLVEAFASNVRELAQAIARILQPAAE